MALCRRVHEREKQGATRPGCASQSSPNFFSRRLFSGSFVQQSALPSSLVLIAITYSYLPLAHRLPSSGSCLPSNSSSLLFAGRQNPFTLWPLYSKFSRPKTSASSIFHIPLPSPFHHIAHCFSRFIRLEAFLRQLCIVVYVGVKRAPLTLLPFSSNTKRQFLDAAANSAFFEIPFLSTTSPT